MTSIDPSSSSAQHSSIISQLSPSSSLSPATDGILSFFPSTTTPFNSTTTTIKTTSKLEEGDEAIEERTEEEEELLAKKERRRKEREELKGGLKAPLPDFRFEEGVLLSIRPFIHRVLSSPTSSTTCEKGKEIEQVEAEEKGASVSTNSITAEGTLDGETNDVFNGPLSIQWGQLTYVIFREQVIYPLLQGIIWGVGGLGLNTLWQWNRARLAKPALSNVPVVVGNSAVKPKWQLAEFLSRIKV